MVASVGATPAPGTGVAFVAAVSRDIWPPVLRTFPDGVTVIVRVPP